MAKTVGIVGVMAVACEGITIIAIESIPGADPDKAVAILNNGGNRIFRKAVIDRQIFKLRLDPTLCKKREAEQIKEAK